MFAFSLSSLISDKKGDDQLQMIKEIRTAEDDADCFSIFQLPEELYR